MAASSMNVNKFQSVLAKFSNDYSVQVYTHTPHRSLILPWNSTNPIKFHRFFFFVHSGCRSFNNNPVQTKHTKNPQCFVRRKLKKSFMLKISFIKLLLSLKLVDELHNWNMCMVETTARNKYRAWKCQIVIREKEPKKTKHRSAVYMPVFV